MVVRWSCDISAQQAPPKVAYRRLSIKVQVNRLWLINLSGRSRPPSEFKRFQLPLAMRLQLALSQINLLLGTPWIRHLTPCGKANSRRMKIQERSTLSQKTLLKSSHLPRLASESTVSRNNDWATYRPPMWSIRYLLLIAQKVPYLPFQRWLNVMNSLSCIERLAQISNSPSLVLRLKACPKLRSTFRCTSRMKSQNLMKFTTLPSKTKNTPRQNLSASSIMASMTMKAIIGLFQVIKLAIDLN